VIAAWLLAVSIQRFAHLPLDAAESAALARSPDVAVAAAKVREQQALLAAARASYGPALTGNYTEGPQGGNAGETIAQRLTTVGAQISLGDLLTYAPAVAQADAALRAAQFDLASAQRSERVTLIGQYYGALAADATARARAVELASAQSEERAARLRFSAGDAPRLDVVRGSVAVAQAQADLARAQADAQNADAVLEAETGVSETTLATVPSDVTASPPFLTLAPDQAIAEALRNRPEIASAQAGVAAEEHAVAVARRGGFPIVTIAGGYTKGVDTGVPVSGPSASVQMNLPLGGAAHDRVLVEESRLAQARAQLEKARRTIVVEVGSAVRTDRAQTAALAAAERALRSAQAEFRATQIGYRNGASSSLDVEAARSTYVTALVGEISALYAQAQAQATLELVIGRPHA
jgi:outer membrane protein TolC